jgi:rhomboid family GlyGly-CTERM serine protease
LIPAGRTWLGLSALLALGSLAGWWMPAVLWDWQPGLAFEQPWRWWTAAFVHWSGMHLTANLAGLAVVAALGRAAQVPGDVALGWLATWPLTHLVLLSKPDLAHYGGLSGVLHAGVTIVATWLLATQDGKRRWIGGAMLAGLVVKLLFEAPWGPALSQPVGWDIAVAPLAHAAGAVLAIVVTLLVLARRPRTRT